MANVITLPDGRNETIFDEQDFMELVERYMGSDARHWLEDWLGNNDDVADYIDDLEKPTAIMAVTTVPKKVSAWVANGQVPMESIYRICKDIPDSLYHR